MQDTVFGPTIRGLDLTHTHPFISDAIVRLQMVGRHEWGRAGPAGGTRLGEPWRDRAPGCKQQMEDIRVDAEKKALASGKFRKVLRKLGKIYITLLSLGDWTCKVI